VRHTTHKGPVTGHPGADADDDEDP
jgi:hypothetical protein